jgi:hypothetical protein
LRESTAASIILASLAPLGEKFVRTASQQRLTHAKAQSSRIGKNGEHAPRYQRAGMGMAHNSATFSFVSNH